MAGSRQTLYNMALQQAPATTRVTQDNNVAQWRAPAKHFTTWVTQDNTIALQQAPATTRVTQDNNVVQWWAPTTCFITWATQNNTVALQ